MSDRIWYLKQCRLFQQLPAADLSLLESRALVRTFTKNSSIYLPRDAADSVYVLSEGRVRLVSITSEGKQAILGFIEPGDLFGELAVAGTEQREEFAEAVASPTKLVAVSADALQEVMLRNASLSLAVTRMIGWRRHKLERRLRSLLFRSNRERLASLLLELVERYGNSTSEGTLIDIKLSHQDLAGVIGVTRESVTLALGEMQLEGLLTVGRQRIIVRDFGRLAAIADEPRRHEPKPADAPESRSPTARETYT